jgi:ubiquinone/menaquinone biosynthesis C-methylase UbiE
VHGPKTLVTGLDRNAGLLGVARRRANPGVANVRRVEADLVALDLPEASFDAVRTERAPHALAHGYLERALDALDRVVRPGGGLALFELDYGATILAALGALSSTGRPTRCGDRCRSRWPAGACRGC